VERDQTRAAWSGGTCADETRATRAVATQATHAVERGETDSVATEATHAVEPVPQAAANGICIPAGLGELETLRRRERRYDEVDTAVRTRPYQGWPAPHGTGLASIGSAEFTRPADIARGFVSASYLATSRSGAQYWEPLVPGFERDYRAS